MRHVLDGFCAACCKQHNTTILHLPSGAEIAEIMMQQVMDAAANFRQLDAAAWNRISYSPHY